MAHSSERGVELRSRLHIFARLILTACVVSIAVLGFIVWRGAATKDDLAIASGVIAVVAAVVGLFATRPFRDDFKEALPAILTAIPEETAAKLRAAELERAEVTDFLERRSNEIFLLKLRSYFEDEVKRAYEASPIARLVDDLESVESQLDKMHIEYGDLQVPQRFRKIVAELNRQERQLTLDQALVAALPFRLGNIAVALRRAIAELL